MVISCILASDSARSFEVADKAKAAAEVMVADPTARLQEDARLAVLEAAVCWGNVSYTSRENSVHKEWAAFLSQELIRQGEREREGSLPESPFCDAQQSQSVRRSSSYAQHHARAHTQTMFSLLHPPPTFAYSLCTLSLLLLQALFHLNMIDLIASPVLHPLLSFAPGAGECVRANEQRDDFIPPTRERRSPSHSPPPSSFLPRPLLLLRCTNSIVAHWRNGHEPVWVARKGTHGATWRRICRAEGGARCDGRRVRVAHND